MLMGSMTTKGWLSVDDVKSVAEEIITGYCTTLGNQSYLASARAVSGMSKACSLVQDIAEGNNIPDNIASNIEVSLNSLFRLYYKDSDVKVNVVWQDAVMYNISIGISVTSNNITYDIANTIPVKSGLIQQYSDFTYTANPYQRK